MSARDEPHLAPTALQQSLKRRCVGHLMLAITPTHYDVISFRTDFLSAQTKPWHPLHSTGQSNSSKVSRGHFIIPCRIDSSWGWLTRRKREKGHGIYNLEYIMHTQVLGPHHCRHIGWNLRPKLSKVQTDFRQGTASKRRAIPYTTSRKTRTTSVLPLHSASPRAEPVSAQNFLWSMGGEQCTLRVAH